MTVILGYGDGQHVWIGGDSLALDGWKRITLHERKVFRLGNTLVGGSGLFNAVQALKHTQNIPEHPEDMADEEYLVRLFTPALRKGVKDADVMMVDNDLGSTAALVGYRGHLYYMMPSFAISRASNGFYATGSGGESALGAFIALTDQGWPVRQAIHRALEIAGQVNATCGPPYYIEELSYDR